MKSSIPLWRLPALIVSRAKGLVLTMKWITGEKVKVDRVACPWLIEFVDKNAEFVFVLQTAFATKPSVSAPYRSMFRGRVGHHGKECSFEAI